MSLRAFYNKHLRSTLKMGRTRPIGRAPRLKLSNYLLRALPKPPAVGSYAPKSLGSLRQMYLNDQLGDCVIACIGHIVGVLTANAGGRPSLFTSQQIVALYSAIGGYVPGVPSTDQGCNEQTALNYWRSTGAFGHKITASVTINPADPVECMTALWLFENLMYGLELPDAYITEAKPDFVWNVGTPDPNNGHCIAGVGWNKLGVRVSTWGMIGTMTWPAMAEVMTPANGGELYTVLSPDILVKATKKSPLGIDWTQLQADLQAIA